MVIPAKLQEQWHLLASLTRLHLLQEYEPTAWLDSSAEVCDFFRSRVQPRQAVPVRKMDPQPQPMRPALAPPKPVIAATIPTPSNVAKPPAPEPIREPTEKLQATRPAIQLSTPTAVNRDDMSDWRRILSETAPRLALVDPLEPETAEKGHPTLDFQVLILVESQAALLHQLLLRDIAQGLHLHGTPARIVLLDAAGQWTKLLSKPSLKLVLASPSLPPQAGTAWLALPNLDILMQEPDKKASLWHAIRQRLDLAHGS